MLVVYGLLILSWTYKSLWIQGVCFVLYTGLLCLRKQKAMVFMTLGLLLIVRYHVRIPVTQACGTITRVFDGGYILEDFFQKYQFFDESVHYRFERMCLEGKFERRSGVFNESHYLVKDVQIKNKHRIHPFFQRIQKVIQDNELMNTVMFGDETSFYTSISLQLTAFFAFLTFSLKPRVGHRKLKCIKMAVCLGLYGMYGLSYGLFRTVLKTLFKKDIQIIILLLMFPGYASKPSFLIPYGLVLMNGLSTHLNIKPYSILNCAWIQYVMGRLHLLEYLLYPLMKILYMPLLPLGFLSFIWKDPLTLYLNMIKFIQSLFQKECLQRFLFVGKFPMVIVMVIFALYILKKKQVAIYCYLITILVLTYYPFAQTSFINVGQGDAILIQMPYRSMNILIDTGRKSAAYHLKQFLYDQGVKKLDYLILTHSDLDHTENTDLIVDTFKASLVTEKQSNVPFMHELLKEETYDNENDNSLIFLTGYGVLLTGDASKQQERDLLQEIDGICPTVIKLGHHGSKTATDRETFKSLQPRLAIVSSKPSVYGHPHRDVMKTLYELGIPALQTSIHGDITLTHLGKADFINTSESFFGIIYPVIKCSK